MRALLLSNSGRPFLEWCRPIVTDFLGGAKTIENKTAASLGDERLYHQRAREALEPTGLSVLHCYWKSSPRDALDRAEAIFVGGGNTYALLKRLKEAGVIDV